MKKNQILFLGYNSNQTSLISFLKKKNFIVKNFQKTPNLNEFKKSNFIILFGFREIIKENILDKINIPIFNIHQSYLPFNRGAHPIFWSFMENTSLGVTIHEICKEVDKDKIIFRKKIKFEKKNFKKLTFKDIYKKIFFEAENLFIKNFSKLYFKKYKYIKINIKGSFHKKNQLPKWMVDWNMTVLEAKKKYLMKKN